jgi:RNA polymerase sigma-70 factor (ECF subfamily)
VLANDPTAPAELFLLVHRPIVTVLANLYGRGGLETEVAGDFATDAILAYLRHPQKFEPKRASLFTYLAMISKGDALNWLQARSRDKKGLRRLVELSVSERNIVEEDFALGVDADQLLRKFGSQIIDDEADEAVLRLMLMGENDTDVYARALGLEAARREQKKTIVKQRRDKLEKRLRRLGDLL